MNDRPVLYVPGGFLWLAWEKNGINNPSVASRQRPGHNRRLLPALATDSPPDCPLNAPAPFAQGSRLMDEAGVENVGADAHIRPRASFPALVFVWSALPQSWQGHDSSLAEGAALPIESWIDRAPPSAREVAAQGKAGGREDRRSKKISPAAV